MRYKTYAMRLTLFAFALPLVAFGLHRLGYINTENDFILQQQLKKLDRSRDEKIATLIVGDSSAGNGVDASFFARQFGAPALNLALTAGYGIAGTFNMLSRAAAVHPEIKNVLIVQSPDMWHRPFSLTGYFKTRIEPLANMKPILPQIRSRYIAYLFNVKEINWYAKYLFDRRRYRYDTANDYTAQHEKRFADGAARIDADRTIPPGIPEERVQMLKRLDRFCYEHALNCIYLHGPMHESVLKNSTAALQEINATLADTLHAVRYIPTFFPVPPQKLGDKIDHIDPRFKRWSTRIIFERAKPFLHCRSKPIEHF